MKPPLTDHRIDDAIPPDGAAAREIGFAIPERYNASEILFQNIANGRGDSLAVIGSTGQRTYAELCSDAGRCRGDSNTPLYWNHPDKTAETIHEGGWICTGDRFSRDADGFYFFRGRADDLIKISGQWVYPMEVELCLSDHTLVRECAVVAVELPDRRMTLKAFVVMKDKIEDAELVTRSLQTYVKRKLLPHKYPRSITFVDVLPKTGTGKIDRQALLQQQRRDGKQDPTPNAG